VRKIIAALSHEIIFALRTLLWCVQQAREEFSLAANRALKCEDASQVHNISYTTRYA